MATITDYTPEDAKKRFESLPQDLKDLLYSPDMTTALEEVGKKHQLHVDQLGDLEADVSAVMLGFTEPQDFSPIIAKRLEIAPTIADEIARELDASLFQKIRESLKKIQAGNATPSAPPQPPAVGTPPAPAQAFVSNNPMPITPPPMPVSSMPKPLSSVEKMLSAPVMSPTKTIDLPPTSPKPLQPAPSAPQPATPPSPPKPPEKYAGTDPYHEPIA